MLKQAVFHISGMTCGHCEQRVKKAAIRVNGVKGASASFAKKRAEVSYDDAITNEAAIADAIGKEGYKARVAGREREPLLKVAPVLLVIVALYLIVRHTVGFDFIGFIPKIDSTISLSALFLTGLLTSVHCIAMCGGINLSQSVGDAKDRAGRLARPLLYNLGRVISYTAVGAIVGAIGETLFISAGVKAAILVVAAVFMLLMGLSMLGWLPWWLTPRLPAAWSNKADKAKLGKGPFVVGLLNGLMPCGPLQAMQLYALASGSALKGALSMLLFSLGTVPLMLGAGVVFSSLKGKFTRGIQRVSAALILFFAVVMASNASALLDTGVVQQPTPQPTAQQGQGTQTEDPQGGDADEPGDETAALIREALDKGYIAATLEDGVQKVETELTRGHYPYIIVQKGVPVEFNIVASKSAINGCNASIVMPSYGIEQSLNAGDNVFSFTPEETGLVSYTCWMGMIPGRILVVDTLESAAAAQ